MPTAALTVHAPALDVRGVRVTYAGRSPRTALSGVDLAVPAGQAVALLGPNGSGKSTLMKVIAGLLEPDEGSVSVCGGSRGAEKRRHLSVVFQTNGLDPHLTVEENLRCQAALYGLPREMAKPRIEEELRRAALADRRDARVKTLSGGLTRRVDLARALLHHPDVLLLDEPTTGLDLVARAAFLDALDERRCDSGMTILMSTHLIDEADRCDRVVFMHDGRVVADGSPGELRRSIGGGRIVTVHDRSEQPPPVEGLEWRASAGGEWSAVLDGSRGGDAVEAAVEHPVRRLARAGVAFTLAPPTLADVFAHVTGASLTADASGAYTPSYRPLSRPRRAPAS